jgi:hypothetical protein
MLDYIDQYEQKISRKLRTDFSEKLDLFEKTLDILAECINERRLGHPDIIEDLVSKDYRELDARTICFTVSSILLGEALNRLFASRRLFLCGYISRALASARDAIESAMVADICRNDIERAKKWSECKQIKVTKQYNYHRALSWKLWTIAQSIMNPLGTHAYMQAAYLSSLPQQAMLSNDKETKYLYEDQTAFVLRRLLLRCLQLMLYIKSCYRDSISNMAKFNKLMDKIDLICTKEEAQISLDELLLGKRSIVLK